MVKGLLRSLGRNTARAPVVKQSVKVRSVPVSVDGLAGVGFGTAVIGDFPAGNILFLGAVAYLQFRGPTSANLVDTWEGDYSIGTAPTADASLAGAEVDVVPSTALAAATAELSPRTRGTQADGAKAGQVFDNTDGSLELNLNLLVDDAHIDANDVVITADGDVLLSYVVLGDD